MSHLRFTHVITAVFLICQVLLFLNIAQPANSHAALMQENELRSCIGGECPNRICRDVYCQINQSPDYNACPVSVQSCSPSTENTAKCIEVSKTTPTYRKCFNASKRSEKGHTCNSESTGETCAKAKVGDKVDGECTDVCTAEGGNCGSSVYTCDDPACSGG
ncbi:MAG: hypothetical protein ABIK07_22770 [Planctomycetota bacterium]